MTTARPDGTRIHRLNEREWKFDPAYVDDAELVACTVWEFARESKTLRRLREQCVKAWREKHGNAFGLIPVVAGNIYHPDNAVEVFLREIVLQRPPDLFQSKDQLIKGSFPDAWQSLSQGERTYRARPCGCQVPISEWQSLPDDKRADLAKERWKAKPIIPLRRGRLSDERKNVEIDWRCTDKEISEAICRLRPKEIPEPRTRRGRGDTNADWRAKLESLALLRLRSRYAFNEMKAFVQQLYKNPPLKYRDAGECNREAEKAAVHFHTLFPFLPAHDTPRSYPLK